MIMIISIVFKTLFNEEACGIIVDRTLKPYSKQIEEEINITQQQYKLRSRKWHSLYFNNNLYIGMSNTYRLNTGVALGVESEN